MNTDKLPLISVIVPVYNVEKYLRRCLDSLLAQTYSNIEIILVNDGSPDKSWEICKEYEASYTKIRALKKSNGGLSSARNFGLNYASGKYIGFVDSDDWVSSDMYEELFNLIKKTGAEVSQINHILATDISVKQTSEINKTKVITGRNEILKYYMVSSTITGNYGVWGCLFKADIVKKFRFREGKINEDIDFKYKVLSDCKKFAISDKICYFYFQSGNSLSSGQLKPKDFDLYDAANELEKLTEKETDEEIRFLGKVKKARTPFSLLCRIAYYGISDQFENPKSLIRTLTAEHRRNLVTLLKAPLPYNRKIPAVLLACNINLLRYPLKCIRKLL